jgi:hypothetical protein
VPGSIPIFKLPLVLNCAALTLSLSVVCFDNWSGEPRITRPSAFRIQPVLRADGGRGRIRTSVARKERQIYSLLVLATHPPVRTGNRHRDRTRSLHPRRDTCSFVLFTQKTVCPFVIGDPPPQHRYDSKISWRRDLNPRPSDYKSDALPLSYASAAQTKGRYQKGTSIARARSHNPTVSNLNARTNYF